MSKHYYIPTSSLNLETILQSESISPYSFYLQRVAGSTIFELLPQYADIKNAIILLDSPVRFSIDDTGRYNFPMLIEIADDKQLLNDSLMCLAEGVYAFAGTINLTPKNSRIVFFDRRHYNITTINVKDSRAIKYYSNYKIIEEWNSSVAYLPTLPIGATEDIAVRLENRETILDKIKGLLYASMLGQSKSLVPNLARLRRLTQEIYNILSVLSSSPDSLRNYKKKIESLLDEYKEVEPECKACQEHVERTGLNFFGDVVVWTKVKEFLSRYRLTNTYEKNQAEDCNYSFLPSIEDLKTISDFKKLKDEIVCRCEKAINNYRKTLPAPNVETFEITTDGIRFSKKLYIEGVIRYIIDNQITPDYLVSNRLELCVNIVNKVIKPVYIQLNPNMPWNDATKERIYFMSLYGNLCQSGVRFNVHAIDNDELQAIATFIYAGADITSLDNYLKVNEICNYDYAYSLWGALSGYMVIPKDVLQPLLSMNNYVTVYHKIYSYYIENEHFENLPTKTPALFQKAEKIIINSGLSYNADDKKRLNEVATIESHVGDPKALLYIIDNVLDNNFKKKQYPRIKELLNNEDIILPNNDEQICEFIIKKANISFTGKNKSARTDRFKQCIMQAIEIEKRIGDQEAFILILDNYFDRKSKIYRVLKGEFCSFSTKDNESARQLSLQYDQCTPVETDNKPRVLPNIWENSPECLVEYIKLQGYCDRRLLKNLISLLNGYASEEGWARKKGEKILENSEIIKHFENYCFSHKNYDRLEDSDKNRSQVKKVGDILRTLFQIK